jgi:hypothetical protein
MTDETGTLRRILEEELETELKHHAHIVRGTNRPFDARSIAGKVADEVLRRLRHQDVQVVRLHANHHRREDE